MQHHGSSLTLYDYLLANCLKGACRCSGSVHVCVPHWSKTVEQTEEPRLLRIRTLLNTIIAISTSVQGAADQARKDQSRPHKSVRFPNKEPYYYPPLDQEVVDVSREKEPEDSESTITVMNLTNRFTPDIIERIIVCDCLKHKHCLTCQFPQYQWDRGLKEFLLAPSRSPQTRWVHALNALERATKVWVGQWAAGIGWKQRNTYWVAEKLYTPVRHAVHLCCGVNDMKDRVLHHVVNALRKVVRCADVMVILRHVGGSGGLEGVKCLKEEFHTEEVEEFLNEDIEELFGKQRRIAEKKLAGMVFGLSWLNDRIESLVRNLIEPFINDMSLGPKYGARKLEFIKAVVIRIQMDVCGFRRQVEEIESGWKEEIADSEEWFKKAGPSIALFRKWHRHIQRGLCDFANRGGRDGGCKCGR